MRAPVGRAGGIRQLAVSATDRKGPELRLSLGAGDYPTAHPPAAPPDRARSGAPRSYGAPGDSFIICWSQVCVLVRAVRPTGYSREWWTR